jgi:hypothetical protein
MPPKTMKKIIFSKTVHSIDQGIYYFYSQNGSETTTEKGSKNSLCTTAVEDACGEGQQRWEDK